MSENLIIVSCHKFLSLSLSLSLLATDAIPLYGYDAGLDPIVLETINCTGNESNPAFCPTSPLRQITNPVCHESNRAAGVRCSSKPGSCISGATRLADGPTYYEGRLEMCRNNTWLAVCEKDFNTTTASNVCNGNLFLAGSEYIATMLFN